jgi:hypothetical protein
MPIEKRPDRDDATDDLADQPTQAGWDPVIATNDRTGVTTLDAPTAVRPPAPDSSDPAAYDER